ncbi:MAG: hypothetical protein AAF581_15705 [Planctomycetota bacterium]
MQRFIVCCSLSLALLGLPAVASAQSTERGVQLRSVDFGAGILEVFNYGAANVDLTGWRFCSHDTDQERQYTTPTGLAGVTIEASTSIFVHFNNDAPAGDPDRFDLVALGNFALPLNSDAYGIQLFFPDASGDVAFGNNTLIADMLQWNIPGTAVGTADFRTAQAVAAGLWTAVGDYVPTATDTARIDLLDATGGLLHGPADYGVTAGVDPRLVQFRSVDFAAGILEVFNFGAASVDLTGWRFCSHDTDQERQYTTPAGLAGVTIEAGTSIFVHFNNDAPAGNPDRFDLVALGNFALPLDSDAYGIQLFFPDAVGDVAFGNNALMADIVQWNIPGTPVGTADFRTAQAVAAGLWTATGDFITTSATTVQVDLLDLTGNQLHGPGDYQASEPVDPRLIQFRSVDFSAGILEVFNFGTAAVDLSGWRFCSHDTDQERQYTTPTGLVGVTIEAGTSIFVHFNNDAPAGDPDRFDLVALGNFALPLDTDAYGIQLFFPDAIGDVAFGNNALLADMIQWNLTSSPIGTADFRTPQAVAAGLWSAVDEFVVTETDSIRISLNDTGSGLLHGPTDYTVVAPTDFPTFAEDFETLAQGDSIALLGWPIVSNSINQADFTVTATDQLAPPPGTNSTRWIRIVDVDGSNAQNRFYSPTINSPAAISYTWRFLVNLETTPPSGNATKPRYTIQHSDNGFANAWGFELTDTGVNLIVTGIGGAPASVSISGPLTLGEWTELRLRADFQTQTVTGWVGAAPGAALPIALTGSPEIFRLCYRGEGAGNVLTSQLDNVQVTGLIGADFVRGDCNQDGVTNIADPVRSLNVLFLSGVETDCEDACDANDDGNYNIGDPVYILTTLFSSGPPPAAPLTCGPDPTVDALGCTSYPCP